MDGHIPDCEYEDGTTARSSSVEQKSFSTSCCILTATEHQHLQLTAGNFDNQRQIILNEKFSIKNITSKSSKEKFQVETWLWNGTLDKRQETQWHECNMSDTQTWFPSNQLAHLNPPEINTSSGAMAPARFRRQRMHTSLLSHIFP